MKRIQAADPKAVLIPTARQFCQGNDCSMEQEGHLMYEDNNHLNLDGSRFAVQAFLKDPRFLQALGNPVPTVGSIDHGGSGSQ